MCRKRRFLSCVFVLLWVPATGWAQAGAGALNQRSDHVEPGERAYLTDTRAPLAQDYRVEVFGDFGAGLFANGVNKGQSARDIGAGLTWRPSGARRRLGLELRIAKLAHHEVETGKPDHNHLAAWLLAGNAVAHFRRDAATQPYVLAGIGFIKASASNFCSTCAWDVGPSGNKIFVDRGESEEGTDPAFLVGAGFKTAVAPRVSIRGELLVASALGASYQARFLDGTANRFIGNWGWTRATIGVGFRF